MLPMYQAKVNSPMTTLSTSISSGTTTVSLVNADVLPAAPNVCTIGLDEDAETIYYGGKNGHTLINVTRGFQGSQKPWSTGTPVARLITAYDLNTIVDNILSHVDSYKPHLIYDEDQDKSFKYGLRQKEGFLVFVYEEVE